MRNKASIYSDCNPRLTQLFNQAGNPAKVLCVPMDYAKKQHTVLICDGNGEVLAPQFCVNNDNDGVKALVEAVCGCAKERKIKTGHVFFGGEDLPSFADNFLRQIRRQKFLVVRVNAFEAKAQRENNQSSNDGLDLLGVARCLLKRKSSTVEDWPQPYANLRLADRDRDKVVRLRTLTSNRIYSYCDRLFPGFLDSEKTGLCPLGTASIDLMLRGLDPAQTTQWPLGAMSQWLKKRCVKDPAHAARELKKLAKKAPACDPRQSDLLKEVLRQTVHTYENLDQSIGAMDRQLAYWLSRTPGAFLTSIPGIGITLAAGWMAELGPVDQWRACRKICSYGGVVPRSKQTGGPGKPVRTGKVTQCANKRFKNTLLFTVEKALQCGPDDILLRARRLEEQGSHVKFGIAKQMVRLCKHLVKHSCVYRTKALMAAGTPAKTLASHYQKLWPKLVSKWEDKADLQDVFDKSNPLGQWRQMAQQLYTLKLDLPRQRGRGQPGVSAQNTESDAGAVE